MKKQLYIIFIVGLLAGTPLETAIGNEHEAQTAAPAKSEKPPETKVSSRKKQSVDLRRLPLNMDKDFFEGQLDLVKDSGPIVEKLKQDIEEWPPVEKEEAEDLIKTIDYNLQQYVKLVQTPPLASQPISLQKNSYCLSEVIELCHQKKQCSHVLCGFQDSLGDLDKRTKNLESLLAQTRKEYFQTEENSVERSLLGLKILSYWTSLIESKEEKKQITEQLESQDQLSTSIEDNIDYAFDHISVEPSELAEVKQQIIQADRNWAKARRTLEAKQAYKLRKRVDLAEDKGYLNQELVKAEVEDMSAHLKVISLEIQETLLNLIHTPAQFNREKLKEDMDEWREAITNFDDSVKKWTKMTLAQLESSVEAFSLPSDEIAENQKQTMTKIAAITQTNQIGLIKLASEIDDSEFTLALLERRIASLTGALEKFFYFIKDSVYWLADMATATLFIYNGLAITFWDILEFFLIILASLWLSKAILAGLTKIAQHRVGIRKSFIYRIHHLIHYAILSLGFILGLSAIGFDLSNLVLIAGALGVGIGFGLQTIVNNFISGIIILFESQLRIGDYIELDTGHKGEVQEINFRSTIIRTNDGTDIILPNAHLISDRVINWTLHDPFRRLHVPFSVAYGTDLELVRKIVIEAAKELPFTLKAPAKSDPSVVLIALGDSGIEFELIVWVDARASVRSKHTISDYLLVIEKILTKNDIEIPFPHMDVRINPKGGAIPLSAVDSSPNPAIYTAK